MVGRELPKADLAVLLECLALDAGIQPKEESFQFIVSQVIVMKVRNG